MRKQFAHISAALAIAAAAAACGGNHGTGNDRRVQGGGNRGYNERVTLRGCVQPAVAGEGYALRHVMVEPLSQDPQGPAEHPLIPRGSWVRLDAGKDMNEDIKAYLNQEVTIVGDVVEPGLNTIGTSGKDANAQQQNPPRSSIANGDAPRIAVEKVTKIAENCAGE